jgi:hypothetical protein
MGRRRGRNKKSRRSSSGASAELLRQFSSHGHQRFIEEAVSHEARKEDQRKYIQRYRKLEDDIISRTVFVTCVRDLKQEDNLTALRQFMTTYGPVEDCFVAEYSTGGQNRFPPGRVLFRSPRDVSQLLASCTNDNKLFRCPLGCKHGCIRILKSRRDPKMLDTMLKDSVISFSASGLSLGHWLLHYNDTYKKWMEPRAEGDDEWFEETRSQSDSIGVSVNLKRRTVKLEISPRNSFEKEAATFRFKDIEGYFEICREREHGYSLIFALKHTPKLFRETLLSPNKEERTNSFDSFGENFGKCLCFKLFVSETDIDRLLLSERLTEMREFGILRNGYNSVRDARPIRSMHIGASKGKIDSALSAVHETDPEVGKYSFLKLHFYLLLPCSVPHIMHDRLLYFCC